MSGTVVPILSSGMSRARRFEQHGVSLKFPAHSTSGVRADDGTVVFAIAPADIECDERGWKSLLWAPLEDGGSMASACSEERLRHCELAVGHRRAEGLVLQRESKRPFPADASPASTGAAVTSRRCPCCLA